MTDFNEDLFHTVDGGTRVSTRQFLFPGGEVGINVNVLDVDYTKLEARVHARVKNSDNLMGVFMATDALRRVYPNAQIHLHLPYIPYARQDRVCNAGEALSIGVVARLINAQNYASVSVVDPHSPVSVALIDRVQVKDQFGVFGRLKQDWHKWTIVAPDMGAAKKVEDFAKRVGAAGVICFNKTRELATGKITGMNCLDVIDPKAKHLVLDDICDGGRTFIELSQHFPSGTYVELAVTHGIFSKGVECVAEEFDMVHTTNSFHGGLINQTRLNVIKV
ncbi:putative ribose-phosphate pyrophosphokinase [Pseudomonas phage UAVern]|uniref:Ribose-phosphate pyrophosphokinase n=1 Tax=Pseudomonas phage UAVern TaxID=2856997 RepID=A0A975YYP0_9CAUD|nr:putative ribose-phosphate pyrophosphokinase [Pseudomonas phage UAVern]